MKMKVKLVQLSRFQNQIRLRQNHTMSTMFRPVQLTPQKTSKQATGAHQGTEALSKSQKLMVDNGLMRPASSGGSYYLLPLALKSLTKLVNLIDNVLSEYSCQKILLPTLTPASLWEATGRLEECGREILTVSDRHAKKLVLSPTHEEAVCDLLRGYPWSYKNLPLKLYQITSKFRDEMKPRFGLLRTREFLMKDLYTFDMDEETSLKTYHEINEAYSKIFDSIGVEYLKVAGTTGIMGGRLSHEYHLVSSVGEDKLVTCSKCNSSFNEELFDTNGDAGENGSTSQNQACPNCKSSSWKKTLGIEVGHAFLLGNKYTKTLKTFYLNSSGKQEVMEMGCYGIGVTRLLAGTIETLSTDNQIRWPTSIAPYLFALVPPKAGSKEESIGKEISEDLLSLLKNLFPNNVIIDDRYDMTIGKRLLDLKKLGIPHVVILGKNVMDEVPLVELYNVNSDTSTKLSVSQMKEVLVGLQKDFKQEIEVTQKMKHSQ